MRNRFGRALLISTLAVFTLFAGPAYAGPADDIQTDSVSASTDNEVPSGWIELDGNHYYMYADGKTATGECLIDGKPYTFDSNGVLLFAGIHRDGMDDDLLSKAWELYAPMQPGIQDMLQRINQARAAVGVAPVVLDNDLSIVAMYRSMHMEKYNYFGHYYNNMVIVKQDLQNYIGSPVPFGENVQCLVRENPTMEIDFDHVSMVAIRGFTNSQSHFETMVDSSFTKVGIGLFRSYDGIHTYIAHVYGR